MKASLSALTVAIAATLCVWSVLACNGAEFRGSSTLAAPDCDPTKLDCATPTPSPSPTPTTCVDGDQLKLDWSGEIKECLIDKKQTYNFDLKKCAEMRQATTFACNWDEVTKELNKLGLLTEVLKTNAENGSKLVSCGQSEDGNRIVVQWVKLPNGGDVDCNKAGAGASITTGCYTLYGNDEDRPQEATTDEQRAKQVYDCMNKL